MSFKSIAKALVGLNVLAFITSAAVAVAFGQSSIPEWLDTATYVGLGVGALGTLMFVGSTSGSSASTGIAASAADHPSRITDALWADRITGISTGALFVLGGISWLGVAWLSAMLLTAWPPM